MKRGKRSKIMPPVINLQTRSDARQRALSYDELLVGATGLVRLIGCFAHVVMKRRFARGERAAPSNNWHSHVPQRGVVAVSPSPADAVSDDPSLIAGCGASPFASHQA